MREKPGRCEINTNVKCAPRCCCDCKEKDACEIACMNKSDRCGIYYKTEAVHKAMDRLDNEV